MVKLTFHLWEMILKTRYSIETEFCKMISIYDGNVSCIHVSAASLLLSCDQFGYFHVISLAISCDHFGATSSRDSVMQADCLTYLWFRFQS